MPASPISSAPAAATSNVDSRVGARPIRSPWLWWHLLSLDAPTVAVVWCWFFAATFGLRLPAPALVTLALGTWWVYVADRLLDGWRSTDMSTLRDRHWFYLRHRKAFVIAWLGVAIPLAYLIFFRVPSGVRNDDIVLCLVGVAYFLLIHGRPAQSGPVRWFPKELAVGFLFPIAAAMPTWVRLHRGHGILLAAIVTFGAACWLNCVSIQIWEDGEAARDGSHHLFLFPEAARPGAEVCPRGLTEFLGDHLMAFAMAAGALSFSLVWLTAKDALWPLFAAVAVSSLLFLALIRQADRLSVLSLRVLADGALLTPLIFFLHVR